MVMVREETEDVTQEVLVKVITKLASYDPRKAARSLLMGYLHELGPSLELFFGQFCGRVIEY